MNDTTPESQKYYEMLFEKLSGFERLKMGCRMFDTAKRIVISSITAEHPNISSSELKKHIFLRFYEDEFSENEQRLIIQKFT